MRTVGPQELSQGKANDGRNALHSALGRSEQDEGLLGSGTCMMSVGDGGVVVLSAVPSLCAGDVLPSSNEGRHCFNQALSDFSLFASKAGSLLRPPEGKTSPRRAIWPSAAAEAGRFGGR